MAKHRGLLATVVLLAGAWAVGATTGVLGGRASAGGFEPIEPLPSAPRPTAPAAPADVAEIPADAARVAQGLAWRVLRKGTGKDHPRAHDKVVVEFTGWTPGGRVVASSVPNEEPQTVALDDAIDGWQMALPLMVKGEKSRFWIPADLANGSGPQRRGSGTTALVFDIELVDFVRLPDPIPVPEDVAAPPADAKTTSSGLAYKILRAGSGKAHPKSTSTVEVHYSGWTTAGELFDSSVQRGTPTRFALDSVIKGWTEGLQLMVVGEKTRFWIPGRLAYGDKPSRPGAPAGTLVFDVELLAIK